MATLVSPAPRTDEDDNPRGGPIGALLIAVPISLALWAAVVFVLLELVH